MSRHKTYGIDLDGVVINWSDAFADYVKSLYDLDFDLRSVRHWDWSDSGVMTKRQFKTAFNRFTNKGLYRTLSTVVSAKKALSIINKAGHSVHFITTRPKESHHDTLESLKQSGIAYGSVTITRDKGKIAKQLGIDVFIDDKTENCINVLSSGVKHIYLFSKYHNLFNVTTDKIIRVSNWQELIRKEGMKWR